MTKIGRVLLRATREHLKRQRSALKKLDCRHNYEGVPLERFSRADLRTIIEEMAGGILQGDLPSVVHTP